MDLTLRQLQIFISIAQSGTPLLMARKSRYRNQLLAPLLPS